MPFEKFYTKMLGTLFYCLSDVQSVYKAITIC